MNLPRAMVLLLLTMPTSLFAMPKSSMLAVCT
ncbi:glutamine synthetase, partial [Pseudomonas urmiensis]